MAQGGASAELAALFAQRRSKMLGRERGNSADGASEERDEQGSGARSAMEMDSGVTKLPHGAVADSDATEARRLDSKLDENSPSSGEPDGSSDTSADTPKDTPATAQSPSSPPKASDGGGIGVESNVIAAARRKLRPTPCAKNRYQSPAGSSSTSGAPFFETPPGGNSRTSERSDFDSPDVPTDDGEQDKLSPELVLSAGEDGQDVKSLVNRWPFITPDGNTPKLPQTSRLSTTGKGWKRTNSSPIIHSMTTPKKEDHAPIAVDDLEGSVPQEQGDAPTTSSQTESEAGPRSQTSRTSPSRGFEQRIISPSDSDDAGRDISNLLMKVDEFTSRSSNLIFAQGKPNDYDNDAISIPVMREGRVGTAQPPGLPTTMGGKFSGELKNMGSTGTIDYRRSHSQPKPKLETFHFGEENRLQKTPIQQRSPSQISPCSGDNKASKENRTNPSNLGSVTNAEQDSAQEATNGMESNICDQEVTTPIGVRSDGGRKSLREPLSLQVLEDELDEVVAQANMNELDGVVAKASMDELDVVVARASLGTPEAKKRGRSSRPRLSAKGQRQKSTSPRIVTGQSPIASEVIQTAPSDESITCEIRARRSPTESAPVNSTFSPIGGGGIDSESDSDEVDSISDDVTVKQRNTRRVCRSVSPSNAPRTVTTAPSRRKAFDDAGEAKPRPRTQGNNTNEHVEAENKRLREELINITMELSVKNAVIADMKKRLASLQPESGEDIEAEILSTVLKQKKFAPIKHRRANQDEKERRFLC